jgi:chromosome segregation ATPase
MNEPPVDRNESMIDIFVLSISESIAPQLTEPLEEKGYRITLFSDSSRLLETLREGKPNLLICDTTTMEDGFEVCRRIKADSDLWVIPVLIFTSASTLADLLNVLDCNADNFLAYPSDLPYRLSLIDTMLSTPVERQTPELIKTQFKINHDDRIYVVSASRRKILEFLLSSFEIAVNKSSELSELKLEIQRLTESAETLEESVTEHTCVIDLLNATVKQKDQKIAALSGEGADKERALAQKTAEIRTLTGKLEEGMALIAKKDENIRTLLREKEEIESFHLSETDALRQQISGLLTKINTAKVRLDSVQREFEEEKTHCISLEANLAEMSAQKDLTEKSLNALMPEHETLKSAFEEEKTHCISLEANLAEMSAQKDLAEKSLNALMPEHETLKSAFEEEKNRRVSLETALAEMSTHKDLAEKSLNALMPEHETLKSAFEADKTRLISAEREIEALMQAKAQTEQELNDKITGLDQTVQLKGADLTRLKEELDAERSGRISQEKQLESLRQEKEQRESSLQSTINNLSEQLDALQVECRNAGSSLETKEDQIKSLERDLAESVAEKAKTEEQFRANQASYDTSVADLNQALAQAAAIRSALETDLDAAKTQARTYADELTLVSQGKEEAGQHVSSLKSELDQLKEALEKKESQMQSLRETLAAAIFEKEKTEEQVKTDMESYKTTFIRLKHDLDETLASRRMLERDLASAKTQNTAYTKELALATSSREHYEHQIRLLTDELERLREEFEKEQFLHRTTGENLKAVEQNRQRFEEDLRTSADEMNSLKARLEDEQKSRRIAEEKSAIAVQEKKQLEEELRALTEERDHQEQDRAKKFQILKKDLETVCNLQKSLEEEVSVLNEEKVKAEQKVNALTLELEQARTALAEEWEGRMTSDERLEAAILERQQLEQSLSQADLAGTEKKAVQEIIAKEPDLPVKIEPASHSLELVIRPEEQTPPPPEEEPGSSESSAGDKTPGMVNRPQKFSGIEDLFEEDASVPIPDQDTSPPPEIPEGEVSPDLVQSKAETENPEYEGEIPDESEGVEEPEKDTRGTHTYEDVVPGPAFSFNRRQWLSLIKWARHSESLSHDQRLQIIRMGRLIQKNRRLTREQEEQVGEMIALVQALGYTPV